MKTKAWSHQRNGYKVHSCEVRLFKIIILEALKMENPIYAPAAGKVAEIKVNEGDEVETNAVLMVLE